MYHGAGSVQKSAPDRIRTCDLMLRRHALYPTELRARTGKRNKPSSVSACAEASHFSGTTVTRRLEQPTRDFPGLSTGSARAAPLPLLGLAPGGVYHATSVTSRPVRSYRTLSPLPVPAVARWPSAVCFLWHFPAPRGVRALPGTLPCGARTFLGRLVGDRGSHSLPVCQSTVLGTSAPRRSRTPNLRIRSPTLYPIELWARLRKNRPRFAVRPAGPVAFLEYPWKISPDAPLCQPRGRPESAVPTGPLVDSRRPRRYGWRALGREQP
jgi:hypothetical protein